MSEDKQHQNKVMWRLVCLLICVMLCSCTKTIDDVYFHGRITLDCNNQLPAKNVTVSIHRYFDRGVQDGALIGTTVTDNDGYYSLITDVKQEGKFEHYGLFASALGTTLYPAFNCATETNDNSNNVEMNCQASPLKAFGFHIKNTAPFNNDDVFNSLMVFYWHDDYGAYDTIAANLVGTNVDTTIYYLYPTQISYKYSFTKDSILISNPDDTISNLNCLDTLNINVFY